MATKKKANPLRGTASRSVVEAVNAVSSADRSWKSRRKDFKPYSFLLRADQAEMLRAEAMRRAVAEGRGPFNASRVLREILDGELDPKTLASKV